jgi:hypothetical protein
MVRAVAQLVAWRNFDFGSALFEPCVIRRLAWGERQQ